VFSYFLTNPEGSVTLCEEGSVTLCEEGSVTLCEEGSVNFFFRYLFEVRFIEDLF